ncbi:MAG: Transposase DDE domain protein [Methanobacterium sp. PtaU1.Bin097]|nr:MAG: Transposase DDE domain protein [Methanobacterium sp. PtaU1.Bin097]
MNIPLNPDSKDPIWVLFGKVIKLIDSRNFQQELARNGLQSIGRYQTMLKIVLLASYFNLEVSHVHLEVENREKLRKFLNIDNLLTLKQIREVYSRKYEQKYLELALKTLNKLEFKKIRNLKTILVDSTALIIDLKFNGKYISKQTCLDKDYKRSFSTSKGHYTGFKMTLAVEHETLRPLAILIYPGSPNDTKIFDEMMFELKRRRLLRKGQLVITDKGFYSACNYLIGINKYKIVPLIFPKKKPTLEVLKDKITNPLDYFDYKNKSGTIYQQLRERLFELLPKWEDFRRTRWKIEKVFQFLKENLGIGHIHAYTKRSVYKKAYLNVLLLGILISHGQNQIQEIYTLQNFT